MQINQTKFNDNDTRRKISGTIVTMPVVKRDRMIFELKDINTQNIYKLTLKNKEETLTYGDFIEIEGKFHTFSKLRNPGQFDYRHYLKLNGISGVFRGEKIVQHSSRKGYFVKRLSYYLKKRILILNSKSLKPPYSDLYTGLIFGEHGTDLPEEWSDAYKKTGLIHLLVVSGSQVALITGVLMSIFTMLNFGRFLSLILILLVHLLFFFVTGGEASILRAIIMSDCILIFKFFSRRLSIFHIISFTILLMLFLDPYNLINIGAQLSFAATISLLYGQPRIQLFFPDNIPNLVKETLSVTISPFIFTLPLTWFYFSTFSIISIITNLIVVLWIEILVVVGFFSTLIGFFIYPIAVVLNNFSWLLMKLLNLIVMYFNQFKWGQFFVKSPHFLFIICMYLVIVLILENPKKIRQFIFSKWGIVLNCIFVVFLLFLCFQPKPLIITILDVDQGDSALIETPKGKIIAVDTGDKKINFTTNEVTLDYGKRVLIPALISKGINKIDLLILSHADKDHYGGTQSILNNYSVGQVVYNGSSKWQTTELAQHLRQLTTVIPINTQRYEIEKNVFLEFYFNDASIEGVSENDRSLLCKLIYKDFEILFTGDVEERSESYLANVYGDKLSSDVLKVSHHGSNTSSHYDLLNNVQAKVALISVGVNNKFNHPSSLVLDRLQRMNMKIFRTDQNGAITLITDGKNLKLKTFIDF